MIHEVFAYLRVKNAPAAIAFYEAAFGAKEKFRLVEPGGRIGHAELLFGSTTVMVSEEFPEMGIHGPEVETRDANANANATPNPPKKGSPVGIHLHVDDADAVVRRVVEAGGVVVRPLANHFYGERSGAIRDPFGHEWLVGHEIEKVSPAEMQRRYDALFAS